MDERELKELEEIKEILLVDMDKQNAEETLQKLNELWKKSDNEFFSNWFIPRMTELELDEDNKMIVAENCFEVQKFIAKSLERDFSLQDMKNDELDDVLESFKFETGVILKSVDDAKVEDFIIENTKMDYESGKKVKGIAVYFGAIEDSEIKKETAKKYFDIVKVLNYDFISDSTYINKFSANEINEILKYCMENNVIITEKAKQEIFSQVKQYDDIDLGFLRENKENNLETKLSKINPEEYLSIYLSIKDELEEEDRKSMLLTVCQSDMRNLDKLPTEDIELMNEIQIEKNDIANQEIEELESKKKELEARENLIRETKRLMHENEKLNKRKRELSAEIKEKQQKLERGK